MKTNTKILLVVIGLSTLASARSYHVPNQISNGQLNGTDLVITETSPLGGSNTNITTIDLSSLAGQDGAKGDKGDTGAAGANGAAGKNGAAGANGAAGSNGHAGKNGKDGRNGVNGTNGRDGNDFNSAAYRAELSTYQAKLNDANQFTADSAAGSIATSAIDFGTLNKGETEIGLGFGTASGQYGQGSTQGYAGAIGLKHGFTEMDSGVVKAWSTGDNYAVGGAIIHKF